MSETISVEESILKSIRDSIGNDPEDSSFDGELVMHINSALMTLNENGIGNVIQVKDETSKWVEFCEEDYLVACRTFVYLRTKMLFDPPPPSLINYWNSAVDENLWRLRHAVESKGKDE